MKRLSLFIILTIILNSCASILSSKYQKVTINTDSKNEILINGEKPKQKSGKYILKKDAVAKQITIRREGYKDNNVTIMQYKKSPLYTFSVIPFGILIFPLIFDSGANTWSYDTEINLDQKLVALPKKDDKAKKIRLNNVGVEMEANDIKYREFPTYKNFKKNRENRSLRISNEGSVKVENTIFVELLNDLLKEKGYIDTTQKILKDSYLDNLLIDATIKGYNMHFVKNISPLWETDYANITGMFYVDLIIDWEVLDFYKKAIYTTTTQTSSGQFPNTRKDGEELMAKAIKDAIEFGLIEFITDKKVNELLYDRSQENLEANFKEILLSQPQNSVVTKLSQAPDASVTIKGKEGHGSGFVISEDGYIITNYHVASNISDLMVIMNDGTEYKAKIVRESKIKDLAILKIEAKNLKSFKINSNKKIPVASEVYVIGTPTAEDLSQTISKGIVSAVRKYNNSKLIQTDASINSGNSGGAILNKQGEVIGIVSSKLKGFGIEGVAFGIPAYELFDSLKISIK